MGGELVESFSLSLALDMPMVLEDLPTPLMTILNWNDLFLPFSYPFHKYHDEKLAWFAGLN